MRIFVLLQFSWAGECFEALLAGVAQLRHCGLDSVHQQVRSVVEILLLVWRAQRKVTELLLLLGAV